MPQSTQTVPFSCSVVALGPGYQCDEPHSLQFSLTGQLSIYYRNLLLTVFSEQTAFRSAWLCHGQSALEALQTISCQQLLEALY